MIANSRDIFVDFHISDHGSVWLLAPVSKAAKEFVADNIDPGAQWFAGSVVIEWRYVEPIVNAIDDAGLSVSKSFKH